MPPASAQMIFVNGRNKRAIPDHFDTAYELEAELLAAEKHELLAMVQSIKPDDMDCIYIRQPKALGLGHAVLCGQCVVVNEPFAVLLADDLMVGKPPVLAQMVEQFDEWQASIVAVQEVPLEQTRRYGMVAGTHGQRPADGPEPVRREAGARRCTVNLGVAGRYILTPGVFDEIANVPRGVGGEIQLTDGIAALMKHEKVYAYRYEGSATTAAARKASCRRMSNWRWPTRDSAPVSGPI